MISNIFVGLIPQSKYKQKGEKTRYHTHIYSNKNISKHYNRTFERFGQNIYTHHQQINIMLSDLKDFLKVSHDNKQSRGSAVNMSGQSLVRQ